MPDGRTDDLDRRVRETEAAVGRVREGLAAVRQRVDDHESDIRAFAPMVVAEAEMRSALSSVEKGLASVNDQLAREAREREDGQRRRFDAEEARERKRREEAKEAADTRRKERKTAWLSIGSALIASVGVIVAAILAAPK